MNMQFQTNLPVEQAVRNLHAAIQEPALAIVDLRSRLPLDGEVTRERVLLYPDRRTTSSYGRFEGHFKAINDATHLIGHYVRQRAGFLGSTLGSSTIVALAFTVDAIVRWQARHETRLLVLPIVATMPAICVFWYRARRARIEAQLLRARIAEILRGSGA
jgi:hypothetical protein